ncbi:ribosomal protein S3 (chloroplast) [Porphyra umbilicalis]|uniref:Small ribosomal subunit protein uS3c n=1 Tax=Porphyra umbilicalis TaxID=2786 RepID=J7F5Q9_PORUM|nr:ribosomal protein S3 [Porphyra umbilicalis]AFC39976.1 ribosomal protein S3 [Porphyra umbilicalis]ASN78780.1 ribosomal protein S3 [Porphyra umbilicalis]|eukprot:ASN78780.1 ribosomal protein S3 (chloroplast) [Porphyra umbilicalis]
MGQKIHPLGFRIGITQKHRSSWFASSKDYSAFLQEDHKIRSFIYNKLSNASIAKIEINRKVDQVEVLIATARPGIVLGKSGSGIESLRNSLTLILDLNKQIRVNVVEISDPDSEATLVAEFITQQLEKRVAFRRAVRQAVQRAQRANTQGVKIQVSGRLNGAEIARSEWVREGRVPLQTLRADIDYCHRQAHTTYGVLGVKVWLFKGELLPDSKVLELAPSQDQLNPNAS